MKRRASLAASDPTLFNAGSEIIASDLDQHDTPLWAAHLIIERKFGHLRAGDVVLEPACGAGTFLRAIPAEVRALGVEIDPDRAAQARRLSGRDVIVGDIRRVELPDRVDAVVGNPPWDLDILDAILERVRPMLPEGGKAGFFLPAYAFQTEGRLLRYSRDWSIVSENVPRRLWEGLKHPAIYAEFTADRRQMLVGFLLYSELASMRGIPERYREEMTRPSGGLWLGAIRQALDENGGELTLQGIYDAIEGRRPTPNPFWRQQIRKLCYTRLHRTSQDTFRLSQAA